MAKIVHPAGAKDVPVGAVVAITVEDAADIAKFKDWAPGAAAAAAAAAV